MMMIFLFFCLLTTRQSTNKTIAMTKRYRWAVINNKNSFSCCFCSVISWGFSCFRLSHSFSFSLCLEKEIRLCFSHHPLFKPPSTTSWKIWIPFWRKRFHHTTGRKKHETKWNQAPDIHTPTLFFSSSLWRRQDGEGKKKLTLLPEGFVWKKVALIVTMNRSHDVKNERKNVVKNYILFRNWRRSCLSLTRFSRRCGAKVSFVSFSTFYDQKTH